MLQQLPKGEMYETSFMHRADVTHVAVTPNDFILTAGSDGDLRFWKKMPVRAPLDPTEASALPLTVQRSHFPWVTSGNLAAGVVGGASMCATGVQAPQRVLHA